MASDSTQYFTYVLENKQTIYVPIDQKIANEGKIILDKLPEPKNIEESSKTLTPDELYAVGYCGIWKLTDKISTGNGKEYLRLGAESGCADCYCSLGKLEEVNGNSEQALDYYLKSEKAGGIKVMINLGQLLGSRGDNDAARYYYAKCIDTTQDDSIRAGAFINLAALIYRTNNFTETEESVGYLIQSSDDALYGVVACINLANHYIQIKDKPKAYEYMSKAYAKGYKIKLNTQIAYYNAFGEYHQGLHHMKYTEKEFSEFLTDIGSELNIHDLMRNNTPNLTE